MLRTYITPFMAVLLALCCGCIRPAAPVATTEPSAEPSFPIQPRHLMTELVYGQHGKLVKALETGPASVTDWDRATVHAALLSDAGTKLLQPGTVVDASWRLAANALHDGGKATRRALVERDLVAARTAFEQLNQACASCHQECSAAYQLPWKR